MHVCIIVVIYSSNNTLNNTLVNVGMSINIQKLLRRANAGTLNYYYKRTL